RLCVARRGRRHALPLAAAAGGKVAAARQHARGPGDEDRGDARAEVAAAPLDHLRLHPVRRRGVWHEHHLPAVVRERVEAEGQALDVEDERILRVCERIPSRRRADDESRRAALLRLALASGYDSSSRLARRAPRPPGSVRGFVHRLSRLSGIVAPTVGAIRTWYALNEAIYCDPTLGDARVPER